jgi:hypothetical protein
MLVGIPCRQGGNARHAGRFGTTHSRRIAPTYLAAAEAAVCCCVRGAVPARQQTPRTNGPRHRIASAPARARAGESDGASREKGPKHTRAARRSRNGPSRPNRVNEHEGDARGWSVGGAEALAGPAALRNAGLGSPTSRCRSDESQTARIRTRCRRPPPRRTGRAPSPRSPARCAAATATG